MVESEELIERWTNVKRVLVSMPEHERQRHWDMGTWGEVTDCGTVACAAGHCGLDSWFRDRGFKLDFNGGHSRISNVENFFGLEGSTRIFHNTDRRPVETVIDEVVAYTEELRKLYSLATAPGLPKIGEEWPEQGGVFSGAMLGRNGSPSRLLIVGPEHDSRLAWNDAIAWSGAIVVANHRDFVLPDRPEQIALFDRVRQLFQPEAYWSREQHESYSGLAWLQYFSSGVQYYWFKYGKLRARSVRSIVIE